jgi:hypothetical protein
MQDEVQHAKLEMLAAQQAAEDAAAVYRRTVRDAVEQWRAGGASLRVCAARIGITEGALRDLLRPAGAPRRSKQRKVAPPQ